MQSAIIDLLHALFNNMERGRLGTTYLHTFYRPLDVFSSVNLRTMKSTNIPQPNMSELFFE